jgi:hypothetical protein
MCVISPVSTVNQLNSTVIDVTYEAVLTGFPNSPNSHLFVLVLRNATLTGVTTFAIIRKKSDVHYAAFSNSRKLVKITIKSDIVLWL